jgi:hypothetical protein
MAVMGDMIASRVGVMEVLVIVALGYYKHAEGMSSWVHHTHGTRKAEISLESRRRVYGEMRSAWVSGRVGRGGRCRRWREQVGYGT